jgi:hypothetical protein
MQKILNCLHGGIDTMAKLRVYMARATVADRNTTVTTYYDDYKKVAPEDLTYLDFKLYDTELCKKFIQEILVSLKSHNPYKVIEHNTYTTNYFNETLASLQQEMNDNNYIINQLISSIDNCFLDPVPDELILRIDETDHQIETLNALHLYFENQSYKILENWDFDFRNKFFSLLEKINQLVHTMETWTNRLDNPIQSFFSSVRLIPKQNPLELTDDDYKTFGMIPNWGGLQLDYATVGKDLWACSFTNDVELIHAKEVKQQLYINPNFSFSFRETYITPEEELKIQQKMFEEFCTASNVEQYGYNWQEPKYNVGRAQLGIIDTDLTVEQMVEKLKVFHKVVGVEIINE